VSGTHFEIASVTCTPHRAPARRPPRPPRPSGHIPKIESTDRGGAAAKISHFPSRPQVSNGHWSALVPLLSPLWKSKGSKEKKFLSSLLPLWKSGCIIGVSAHAPVIPLVLPPCPRFHSLLCALCFQRARWAALFCIWGTAVVMDCGATGMARLRFWRVV
jgi:hypothetical protein